MKKEKRYSTDEILSMVHENEKIPFALKNDIHGFIEGAVQAMYNMHDNPKKYMKLSNTHGDKFCEGYNWVVQQYQAEMNKWVNGKRIKE